MNEERVIMILFWIIICIVLLLMTGVLTRITNWLLMKKIERKKTAFISFGIGIVLFITIYTIGDESILSSALMFLPPLAVWLLWDLIKIKEVR
jgi:energy-converting hydrogenase Eha subunit F